MNDLLFFLRKRWLICSTVILAAITILSLWPLKTLPPVPGGDKFHHFLAYTVLAFPVALRRPSRWLLIIALFISYSGIIELIQPIAHRYAEWSDLAANTTGVLCGILLAGLARWWTKEKKRENR